MTILIWIAASAALIVLGAAAAELGARWWIHHRSGYYVLPPGLRLRLEPDRDVFPGLERRVQFDVNRDGERGPDPPRKAAGLQRILVAGGSQPEGYLLDQDSSWPGVLHQILNRPESLQTLQANRVHVGSIARSGVGSEALDLILERVLPRYRRLAAIIILVGASDVFRWLEFGAPPSAPPPVRVPDVFRCHPELTFGWRVSQTAILELVRRVRQRWLRPVQMHGRACRWIAKARLLRAQATETRTTTPDPSPMLAHFEYHFRNALQNAKACAERVIVVRQPWFDQIRSAEEAAQMWHGAVGQVWKHEVSTFYSHGVLSSLMARVDTHAADVASEVGVEQVDLMPLLERSVTTFYDFCHLTPRGARVVAETVAAAVLRRSADPLTVPAGADAALPPFEPAQLQVRVS